MSEAPLPARQLVKYVARCFYTGYPVVILDFLTQQPVIKDEDLAALLGVTRSEMVKHMSKLLGQRLACAYARNEVRPGGLKAVERTYYFIDYKLFIDVVKLRLYKIGQRITAISGNAIESQGWYCPRCKANYKIEDAGDLLSYSGQMICTVTGCETQVIDNGSAEENKKHQKTQARLQAQTAVIQDWLRKTDTMTLPAFDVANWLAINMPVRGSASELPDAQGGAQASEIRIEMGAAGLNAAQKAALAAAEELKAQQNALPVWIAESTVAGLDATAQSAASTSENALASPTSPLKSPEGKQDAKPAADAEYEAYYARMQARDSSNTMQSPDVASPTRSAQSSIAYGKRPLFDAPDAADAKRSRIEEEEEDSDSDAPPEETDHADSLMVVVDGEEHPFQTVVDSQALQDAMRPDEYDAFMEIYASQS
ncbi:uncharacterized protein L969DRAFT_96744 [Mixia osmundae IAM 14324]|uniref:HTH TFE/IIEalpha-type domain-containing protein n=1 Tax=Mixia osmundae (strain CBS 9802 / IAM 14324 / JCM 22182 / KY 12970) TaxID=764103 RepID=G7DZL1_MIXOS|nr:uncharacterized protein L969DRAFT_96744 [Mixia osmundae IAM 14324]KEI37184.1 hypothetical protein L969DRAFT_96744 [Mixia osmundae IAM 14324]GAA96021.1 hypothetical protein E5Q_02681 [Mixia osmundae IAM 14324]